MYVNIVTALLYYIFFLISIHSLAEQSLRGIELQKKKHKKITAYRKSV